MPPEAGTLTGASGDALRRLLVAATAAALRPDPDPRLPALVAAAPVEHLPAAAALHRVDGCVHAALAPVAGVPECVVARLASARSRSAARHLVICRALATIADAFDRRQIPWVVMKGPVLSSTIYHDAGARAYNDLDLLVAADAFPDAVSLLEELGYAHLIENWALASWFRAGELPMRTPTVTVDLHWQLQYANYHRRYMTADTEGMLARRRRVTVASRAVPTFDAVDTLLHIALHASRDNADRLVWFKDIERCAAVERPDLDELVARAGQCRCGPPIGLALRRAREVLGADIPDEVVTVLMGRALRAVDRVVTRVSRPVPLHGGGSLAGFVARSVTADLPSTARDLVRRTYRHGRERLLGHEGLRRHPEGLPAARREVDKQQFLQSVATGWRDA